MSKFLIAFTAYQAKESDFSRNSYCSQVRLWKYIVNLLLEVKGKL